MQTLFHGSNFQKSRSLPENGQLLKRIFDRFWSKKQKLFRIEKIYEAGNWYINRKEDAESAGENRRTLASMSAEILAKKMHVSKMGIFDEKSQFSQSVGRIGVKICMQVHKAVLEKWNLNKEGSFKNTLLQKPQKRQISLLFLV